MDLKSCVAIGLAFLITWALVIKIELAEGMCASYFVAVWFLTWVPGIIAFIFARFEGFKIPIFKGANSVFFRALLMAICLGVCVNFRPNLSDGWASGIFFLLFYPIAILIGAVHAIGETTFWWGYIYKKLEHLHPIKTLLIIGVMWGLWHAPLILMTSGYFYDKHRLEGVAIMPLFTLVLSPLMLYFRRKGGCVLTPTIFYGAILITDFLRAERYHNNDLIDGIHGIHAIEVLFVCSCVALFFLWKEGAFKQQKIAC